MDVKENILEVFATSHLYTYLWCYHCTNDRKAKRTQRHCECAWLHAHSVTFRQISCGWISTWAKTEIEIITCTQRTQNAFHTKLMYIYIYEPRLEIWSYLWEEERNTMEYAPKVTAKTPWPHIEVFINIPFFSLSLQWSREIAGFNASIWCSPFSSRFYHDYCILLYLL